jgi:two-component system, OmpR family, alkaline phosphatase synthesis response regulator PhoP
LSCHEHNEMRDPGGRGVRVLVVDDDYLLRRLLRHRLEARGFEVDEAEDGGQALAWLEGGPPLPDVLVLDAMMPSVDGFEVLRRLRADPVTARLPVVMLTARREEADVVSGLRLGADDYLVKPFMPEELVLRIRRLVDARR